MKTNNNDKELLANALEEAKKQNDDLKKENERLTEENSQLKSENADLSTKAATASKSMISWEDHQKTLNAAEEKQKVFAKAFLVLKTKYDKLAEERRYLSTQQWVKRFFRWLFLNRHQLFGAIFLMFLVSMIISVWLNVNLKEENEMLHATDMKYRYIKAIGQTSKTIQFLEDAFEEKDLKKLKHIQKTVKDYEHALLLKSDSIVRAERKKTKDLR